MTISVPDSIFVLGAGVSLAGCWMLGTPAGLVGTGLMICLVSVILHRGNTTRQRQ